MIDWKKSADLNNMDVDELKARFERFPKSHKEIVAVCDNPECNKERILHFDWYRDLCKSCAREKLYTDPEERKKQVDAQKKRYHDDPTQSQRQSVSGKKRYEDPIEHEKSSIAQKKSFSDDPTRAIRQSESNKNSKAVKKNVENQIGGQDIVKHHYIYDHNDLTKYTTEMTRSRHTELHWNMRKSGIKIPHINIKGDINE